MFLLFFLNSLICNNLYSWTIDGKELISSYLRIDIDIFTHDISNWTISFWPFHHLSIKC